jgi:hypothetical protein
MFPWIYSGAGDLMIHARTIAILLLWLPSLSGQGTPAFNQESSAKTWVGRYQEMEEYLRTAECVNMLQKPDGRHARCNLPPGGPIARLVWRSPDGVYRGFRESYKTEIAAYEIDKLLKMDMVPPTVERQLLGIKGAAQLWLDGIVGMQDASSPDESHRSHFESQLVTVKMFDNLIGNRDRNTGNILRDPAWNLFLVDHARAFGTGSELPNTMTGIDREYWTRIEALTRKQLDDALGAWLDQKQVGAILDRRERMRDEIKRGSRQGAGRRAKE